MERRLQLVSSEEAVPTDRQHHKPCGDCPWARTALNGWLGMMTPEAWLHEARSESAHDCHTLSGAQCAGLAIYRANVCKSPRDKRVLRLPVDRERVFATPGEFLAHHHAPLERKER